jgi:hypothetical protein
MGFRAGISRPALATFALLTARLGGCAVAFSLEGRGGDGPLRFKTVSSAKVADRRGSAGPPGLGCRGLGLSR